MKKLGFEYSDQDDADTSELRTRAIEQAALAKDPGYVNNFNGELVGDSLSTIHAGRYRSYSSVSRGMRRPMTTMLSLLTC